MLSRFLNSTHSFPIWKNNWVPKTYSFFKDKTIANKIMEHGYAIIKADKINYALIESLYTDNHTLSNEKGGMFYSIYSKNLSYRQKIHEKLGEYLDIQYNHLFSNYKSVLNSFVVKKKGEGSEFKIHQDSTGLNEWEHSPINVWIPLTDVDENNGCLHLIPTSHYWASPYRGISIPPNYENVIRELMPYFKPIILKKGEILLFDNRVLHTSSANYSDSTRIVAMSGIFPKEAQLYCCHQEDENSKVQSMDSMTVIPITSNLGRISAPIIFTIPLQLLSYHVALSRETNVDKPRNLAKSVTVE